MNLKLYSSLDRVRVSNKNITIEASGKHVKTFIITASVLLVCVLVSPFFIKSANN
jgi:hypothetical protein